MGLSKGPRKLATTTGQRCKVLGGCWQENDFSEGSCSGQASAGSWPTRAGNRPTEMGYFKSSRLCLRGQHAISIHFPNSKGGGQGEYQEVKMNLGTFAPPCKRGCVQAHRQPASANWTSSPALNLASWKSFFKYILFNLLKSRPACGREGLLAFVGPGHTWAGGRPPGQQLPGLGCQPPRSSAQQVEVEVGWQSRPPSPS